MNILDNMDNINSKQWEEFKKWWEEEINRLYSCKSKQLIGKYIPEKTIEEYNRWLLDNDKNKVIKNIQCSHQIMECAIDVKKI